ncbi:zf-HC2 domain-containing protein [Pseudomonas sp. BJa5]|uniref:anti-sigma factor family protein n=1 Tax=Pseudomonas sp. BJa5 TaxID=2936270 RepID=UPI003338C21C
MLNCRDISELASEFIDGTLSLGDRNWVFIHLRQCMHCSRYIDQLELTSRVLQALLVQDRGVDSQAIVQRILGHVPVR